MSNTASHEATEPAQSGGRLHTEKGTLMDDEYMPQLYDANTAEPIGPATPEQVAACDAAALENDGSGVFLIDADGDPVADGSWDAAQPGVRRVYTL
jgi:hypothetical protein